MGSVNLNKTTVSLTKHSTVNLSKTASDGLNEVMVGLGWDPVGKKNGFFSRLFGSGSNSSSGADIDCDAWVACFDANNNHVKTVYYGDKDYIVAGGVNAVHHHGDNLTGEGDGDDERVTVRLSNMPANVDKILVGVTIFAARERHQSFGSIKNTFIRLVDSRDNFEMCNYKADDLTQFKDKLTFFAGYLYRDGNDWSFKAVGEGSNSGSISDAVRNFRF